MQDKKLEFRLSQNFRDAILEQAKTAARLSESIRSVRGLSPSNIEAIKSARHISERIKEAIEPLGGMKGYSERLREQLGARGPALSELIPPGHGEESGFLPSVDLHPEDEEHPSEQTNRHLVEVRDRLQDLERLGLDMAETIRSMSDSASAFLVDFKNASEQADQTSRRAMRWAVIAVVSTFLLTITQIAYSEWRAFKDGAASDAALAAISRQISELIVNQKAAIPSPPLGQGAGMRTMPE